MVGRVMVLVLVATLLPVVDSVRTPVEAATIHPAGFSLEPVFGGTSLVGAASMRFAPAPDTRVFVAEQRGRLQVFDDIYDTTPTQVIDLESDVHGFWDRGLLGLALDPDFATRG